MQRALTLWSIVGVPATFFIFVAAVVKAAEGKPPFLGSMALWAVLVALVLLITGAAVPASRTKQFQLLVALGYIVAMAAVLAAGAVLTSVAAGDIQ